MMDIHIYTDGSSRGNPGKGGFGTILSFGEKEKEISEGYRKTTNNRMELLAVIKGLHALKRPNLDITVVSDSKYVVDTITKGWLNNWVKTNFKKKKNADLWKAYINAAQGHRMKFKWIKGHAGHPMNERCDQLAVNAALGNNLKIDEGYEESLK